MAKEFNPYGDVVAIVDQIEKAVGISDATMSHEGRMSTGVLTLDLVLNGGIAPGWYTNFGMEQCCKSTLAMTMLMSSLKTDVPFKAYYDYEGSSEPTYVSNIAGMLGVNATIEEIFGVKDRKGNWVVPPKIRYRSEAIAEKFFDYLARLERKLPDKVRVGDQWYYIYEDTKETRSLVGTRYEESYYKSTGKLRVPAPNGDLQAFVVVDSYPSMFPERLDVDDPGAGLAAQARMFSENLPRVKGRMRSKRIAVVGVNQLRTAPMVRFGNPEYETGGNALKLYSDVRLRMASRAISAVHEAVGKGVEEEESVLYEGKKDTYRYVYAQAHKNKLGQGNRGTFLRLWIDDGKGNAHGFDPVYDTYEYLKSTGQLEGKRKKMTLCLKKNGKEIEFKRPFGWSTFKKLILGDKETQMRIFDGCKVQPIKVRQFCFNQIKRGDGLDMFFSTIGEKESEKRPSDGDDD